MRRIAFAALCVVLAVALAQGSRIGVAKTYDEPAATLMWPGNGFAMADTARRVAQVRVASESAGAQNVQLTDMAPTDLEMQLVLAALAREPLASDALVMAALRAGDSGDQERMDALLANTLELTKRDAPANLWQMQQLALGGDYELALDRFRETLNVHPELVDGLVPALVGMVADERVRQPLAQLLDEDPFWELRFWRSVLRQRELLPAAAEIRLAQSTVDEGTEQFDQAVLQSLTQQRDLAGAFAYYRAIGGPAAGPRDNLIAGRPAASGGRVQPIDWDMSAGGGVQVVIEDDPPTLSLRPVLRGRGLAASRLVEIAPGSYRLVAETRAAPSFAVELRLRCAGSNARPVVLPLEGEERAFAVPFNVAGGACRVYELAIDVPRGANDAGNLLVFERIAIEPAS